MLAADSFIDICKDNGFKFFTGTPCSYLKPLINTVIDRADCHLIDATNEGESVAVAAGLWLQGSTSVVMFQNSGLGNAINPLTSLIMPYKIPFLGLVSLREKEPQHQLMGKITTKILDLIGIEWAYLPNESKELKPLFEKADHAMSLRKPFFFILRNNTIANYELKNTVKNKFIYPKRIDAIKIIKSVFDEKNAIFSTTGKTSRELYHLSDADNQFYMVGSMGCVSSLALGSVIENLNSNRKTIVIDGDGALLMRLEAMANIGSIKPKNFIHILLDNESHDSTGGQKSLSTAVDFMLLAQSMGYSHRYSIDNLPEFEKVLLKLKNTTDLSFIHLKIAVGSLPDLQRPNIEGLDIAQRFHRFIVKK